MATSNRPPWLHRASNQTWTDAVALYVSDSGLRLGRARIASVTCGPSEAGAAGLSGLSLDKTVVTPGSTVTVEGANWPKGRQLQAAICGGGSFSVIFWTAISRKHAALFGPGRQRRGPGLAGRDDPACSLPMRGSDYPGLSKRSCAFADHDRGFIERAGQSTSVPWRGALSGCRTIRVVSNSSWTSWFGAAASMQLTVSVHNAGSSAIRPFLIAHWAEGSDHYVITSPKTQQLGAGQSMQITAPLDLSTFADGTFPVVGKVSGSRIRGHAGEFH